jgi:alpha-ribazole phosphatase
LKTITFIRHGESVSNAGGITMAHHAIPLTAQGEQQAQTLAKWLPAQPTQILTSSYARTQQTAQPYLALVGMQSKPNALLNEFSALDPALIEGMNGAQRKPFMDDYWREPSMDKRMGTDADTFTEFVARVDSFACEMQNLPDGTVIFGHGIWMGMLVWQALGFACRDDIQMRSFRRFQLGLPMPNCAVYRFVQQGDGAWCPQADAASMQRMRVIFP